MKKTNLINAMFLVFALVLVSCSEKINRIFSEMARSAEFVFVSDTINKNIILRKEPCILEIDNNEQMINGRPYYRISMCSGDNRNINGFVRKTDSRVYIYQQADKYGFGEQLLFDFDGKVGDCWDINTLDKLQVCVSQRYSYSNGDTIVVHAVKHVGNVSDYPRILEYHVGSRIGITKLKFSDGDYVILEKK